MSVQTWSPTQSPIILTDAAIAHLQRQIKNLGHGKGMRFGVRKSGCTGFAYTVDIIDAAAADERVYPQKNELFVAVSEKDYIYLQGTKIDYVKDGLNHVFQYNNPNVDNSCGCGESVSFK